ncbi:YciI family protein [Pengzhenrongella sicca]|uniref:YCII-related domain-containing protein n=1 Tax=Pengzhenrongella sicca TaxID=2819238 RepID=A0A8A4ZGW8_9MICO|nr:YciI family protein [Pengzhenrongella sicca]QTE31124.1 hypothetical protein J4E96_09480 [Pengzhenrongella sicca]
MTVYAVRYTYDARSNRRDEVRPEHRAFLAELHAAGTLLASGPLGDADDGTPGALLIVAAASAEAVAAVLDADPFAREGLVAAREVRAWTQVYGPWTD